ncbi:MAG: YqjK-like family protein [Pseudomonadota bacterium]
MNDRKSDLMQNRAELLARIAAQRKQVTEIGSEWQAPLALADQGVDAVLFLRRHPLLVAGAVVFFVIRRRGMAGLAGGVWGIWKGYRYFISMSEKLLSRG